MKRLVSILLIFGFPLMKVWAEPLPPIYISQILAAENVVVASGEGIGKVELGNILLSTFADGSQCSMRVTSKATTHLVLFLSDCPKKYDLKVQQGLDISLVQVDTKPVKQDLPAPQESSNEMTGQNSNQIQSVYSFSPVGVFDLLGGLALASSETEIDDLNIKTKSRTTSGDLRFRYGVSEWLNAGIQASYVFSKSNESEGSETDYASGLRDPNLELAFQPVKQGEGKPFNLIFTLLHSPKIADAEFDNVGKGYDSTSTSMYLSRFYSRAELGMLFSYYRGSSGESTSEDGTKMKFTDQDGYLIGGYGQIRASDFLYLLAGIGFGRDSEQQSKWKSDVGAILMQVNSYDHTLLRFGAKLVMIPEVSLFEVSFINRKVNGATGWININGSTSKGDIDKMGTTMIGLSWIYRL